MCATSGSENHPTWCRHKRSQVATTTSANLRRLEEIEELKHDFEFHFEFQEKSALTNIGNKDHPKWWQIWSQVATNTVPSGRKECPVATACASATSAADFRDSSAPLAPPSPVFACILFFFPLAFALLPQQHSHTRARGASA